MKKKEKGLKENEAEKSKKSKKGKKQKGKKSKEEKKVILETPVVDDDAYGVKVDKDKGGKITEQESNIIFKFIFEHAKKRKNQTIDINELWNIIEKVSSIANEIDNLLELFEN